MFLFYVQDIVLGLQQNGQNFAPQGHGLSAQLNLVALHLNFWMLCLNDVGNIG